MTTPSVSKTLSTACLVGGLLATCILTAMARAAIEFSLPINSGVDPLYPFMQLPIYLLLSTLVALLVIAITKRWKLSAMSARQHAALGAVCGLSSTFQLATPWAPEVPALVVATGIALGLAVFFRARMGGRGGA